MRETPRVTVLMSVYNGEKYLEDAINSILQQTFADFEFLIINDGSTDNSRDIIVSYEDPRIRLFDNPANIGLTNSLNRGLGTARGDLIARQDADDISRPTRFEQQVGFLERHPQVALLGTQNRIIDQNGCLLRSAGSTKPIGNTALRWYLMFDNPFIHTSVMFRRKMVCMEFKGYDDEAVKCEDFELWSRIARKYQVRNLPQVLVDTRIHPESIMAAKHYLNPRISPIYEKIFLENIRVLSGFGNAPKEYATLLNSLREGPGYGRIETPNRIMKAIDVLFKRYCIHCPEAALNQDIRCYIAFQYSRIAYYSAINNRLDSIKAFIRAVSYDKMAIFRGFAGQIPIIQYFAFWLFGESIRHAYRRIFKLRRILSLKLPGKIDSKNRSGNNKIKVLLLATGALPQQGGLEYKIHYIANALVSKGLDVTMFSKYKSDPNRIIEKLSINYRRKFYWLPRSMGLFHSMLTGLYLAHMKRKFDFDILIATLAYPCGYWAIRVRDKIRAPVAVITEADDVQGQYDFCKTNRVKRMIRQTLASADAVTAVCKATASDCLAKGASVDRLSVIPNGVDHESIKCTKPMRRERPYILTISSPHPVKGIDVLLHAFNIVSKEVQDFDLIIIGVSPDDKYEKLSSDLKLNSRVTFVGTVIGEEKYALLNGCKLFVLPSRNEAFPLALLEAKAAGKPIVATRVGCIPEIIDNGNNGLLVPPNDADALADAILSLLKSPALLTKMAKRSSEKIHLYSWPRIGDQYISILKDLLSRGVPFD